MSEDKDECKDVHRGNKMVSASQKQIKERVTTEEKYQNSLFKSRQIEGLRLLGKERQTKKHQAIHPKDYTDIYELILHTILLIPFQKDQKSRKYAECCEDSWRYGKIFFRRGLSRLVCYLKTRGERGSSNLQNCTLHKEAEKEIYSVLQQVKGEELGIPQ